MTGAGAILAILASAIVVLGGLAALTRAVLRIRDVIRDNVRATNSNTNALSELKEAMNGRLTRLEEQVAVLMGRHRR